MENEHLIACLVENHPGVLSRISGMFSSRGYNIESLAVGVTSDPTVSRITIVARGDDAVVDQIIKQLNRLVDVINVLEIGGHNHVQRELMLVKVKADGRTRSEVMQICDIFRSRIIDVSSDYLIIETSGTTEKNEALLEMFRPFGIVEINRTGRIALHRGAETLRVPD